MQLGFFDDEATEIKATKIKEVKTRTIKGTCKSCGLSSLANSPKLGIQGKGLKEVLIVIEKVSKQDDKNGKYLTDRNGKNIKESLSEHFNVFSDCWIVAATQCYSSKKIKANQCLACSIKVQEAIKELKPKVIITFGKAAIDAVVNHKITGRVKNLKLIDWVGYQIPDQDYKTFICPTYDDYQYFVPRNANYQTDIVIKNQMIEHIYKANQCVTKPFYISNYGSEIMTITNKREAIDIIKRITRNKENEAVSIDYETTGIKPYRDGHKIVSASISDGLFSYAFPFFNDEEFRTVWKEFLLSKVKKIIHNAKYENTWSKNRSGFNNEKGTWIKNIIADTMIDAHIIHNKKKVGLKFLVYVYFGIIGYDAEIDPYLEPSQEEKDKYGANAINRIEQFITKYGIEKLLIYNGYDTFFDYKLWEVQQTLLLKNLTKKGSEFFLEGSLALGKAENKGILLDTENAKLEYKKLTKRMEKAETVIQESEEMKLWDKDKAFRPSAPGDLTHLLFKCMNIKGDENNLTATGKYKADVEALEQYDNPIVKNTLQWRKLKKVRDTYLNGFLIEETDNIIHTSLNLHTVDTYRSSSNDPNLQNVPARDVEVMNLLRRLIITRRNRKLAEYDYKAMEAVIIAIYNKDPNWIRYVSDPANDMHRDMAAKLVLRKKTDVMKDERQIAKNGFVFPTVYTSYYKNTAKNMWDQFSPETFKHLRSKGIKTLNDYTDHVKSVERWFWEDQFPVGYEWMNKTVKDYEKKGYVDLYTGFRCYGPMTKAQVINTPIQGTASHCKLWTFKELSKLIERKKMSSRLLLEIHDSIIPDVDPAEEAYLDYQVWLYGTQKIRENWEWLIVPLFIEKKISKVNGSWAEMENMGLLSGDY